MIIKTRNSTYTLEPLPGGAWELTGTNEAFAGPFVVAIEHLKVGQSALFSYLNGPKVGRALLTSTVQAIEGDRAEG